jgi:pseudaminic acid cytidylyltransferase
MKKIAIIPARGGSKRIPLKNIKNFLGKPIISYSIDAAIKSGLFDEIMVSTDDLKIADVVKSYGVSIPFLRSQKNSNDFATTADVLIEVLNEYKKIGKEFDYFCCIYPTAPFVTGEKLIKSFNLITDNNADSIIPVVKFSYPIQRSFRINEKERLEYIWPENTDKRSQDLEPIYHDAGQFYFVKNLTFLEKKSVLCGVSIPFILSQIEVQDIDNEEDWKLAENKYQLLNINNKNYCK